MKPLTFSDSDTLGVLKLEVKLVIIIIVNGQSKLFILW